VLSWSIERGATVPLPVVPGVVLIVPLSGVPFVLPLSAADDGSVGDGVVALTPGPDWFAGAGELCAKALATGNAAIKPAMNNFRMSTSLSSREVRATIAAHRCSTALQKS
jgi:hypothetical protein